MIRVNIDMVSPITGLSTSLVRAHIWPDFHLLNLVCRVLKEMGYDKEPVLPAAVGQDETKQTNQP